MKNNGSSDTVHFKGRYGVYRITKKKARAYTQWLKTPEGRAWLTSCVVADTEYTEAFPKYPFSIHLGEKKKLLTYDPPA
jgi:hypothetical protein